MLVGRAYVSWFWCGCRTDVKAKMGDKVDHDDWTSGMLLISLPCTTLCPTLFSPVMFAFKNWI